MTNELEKKFFDTFGIEPEYKTCIFKYCKNKKEYDCENCGDRIWHYPQITDRILLNLICIANQYEYYSISTNIKNIQAQTLRILIKAKKYLKDTYSHQGCHNSLVRKVRKLFKGDNNV